MMIIIAPGASGRSGSMQSHVEGLAQRGITAQAIDLPLRRAEAAVPVYRLAAASIASPREGLVITGQSYGGRVASLLAAADRGAYDGLICFSYPLHRPGAPDWEARTEHWLSLDLPVLLLSGEADPFARIDLLRRARGERLPRAELVTYPRVGHSLRPVLADALDHVVAFVRAIEGARGR
jgi:predicted alpha/beta-hydrolase family hydrolase